MGIIPKGANSAFQRFLYGPFVADAVKYYRLKTNRGAIIAIRNSRSRNRAGSDSMDG